MRARWKSNRRSGSLGGGLYAVFVVPHCSLWELEREREREIEREREVFGGWENEGKWKSWNIETSEGFFFFFFFNGKGWVEFGYIVFGLNGSQWVFN